jgi:hypothetical protein
VFGSHKKQGREAGLATSNIFASASVNTSLFSFDKGFQPTMLFLQHPYVVGFSATTISFMMKVNFNGENWSPKKKAEFMSAATHEFLHYNPRFTPSDWLALIQELSNTTAFATGQDHAEGHFCATMGLISPTSTDPLAVKAREAAENFPPPANLDLATGMLWITVKDFLEKTFPN